VPQGRIYSEDVGVVTLVMSPPTRLQYSELSINLSPNLDYVFPNTGEPRSRVIVVGFGYGPVRDSLTYLAYIFNYGQNARICTQASDHVCLTYRFRHG
jgi:hypothetical protein